MNKEKKLYSYCGGVLRYDRVVADRWFGETMAVSEKQAANNLVYQFRKAMGYVDSVPIKLAGKAKAESAANARQ